MKKVRMRLSNDSHYVIIEDFKFGYFNSEEEYENEILGTYKGQSVMVNKEDYYNSF